MTTQPAAVTAEQIEALRRIDTPTVCNAIEKLGIRPPTEGHMGSDVRCLLPGQGVMVGYAITAEFASTDANRKSDMSAYWRMFDAIAVSPKPVVVVAEEVGPAPGRGCIFGDGMATVATRLGAVGLVTNSNVRDIAGIRAVGLSVFAAGLVPSHGNFNVVEAGVPVEISGVTVTPGLLVHGDENGVVVFPAEVAADVVRLSQEILAYEARMFAFFRSPEFSLEGLKKLAAGS